MKAFRETAAQTIERLGTDPRTGLDEAGVMEQARRYGVNSVSRGKPEPLVVRILHAVREPMILLLLVAGLITVGMNVVRFVNHGAAEFAECLGIFAAIALAVAITIVMEGRSKKAFEALNKIKEDIKVKVLRNSMMCLVPQKNLVVGDIVQCETGDKIPVDGRLIESVGLKVDESPLTGESLPVKKDAAVVCAEETTAVAERCNMLYAGSFVTAGAGRIIVTDVGDATEFGGIARELAGVKKGNTPLQEKLQRLGKIITMFGASMAAIVFLVQVIASALRNMITPDGAAAAFLTSIILIVAAVPEGLPTIVAVSLALNIIKMAKQNALVKKMIASETIGCIDIICSDKTGTLTENRMTVSDIFSNGEFYKPQELPAGIMSDNFCLNSTAHIERTQKAITFIGNPTECALLVAYEKSIGRQSGYACRRANAEIAHTFPFSSESKNMTTVVGGDGRFIAFSKGSPEKILAQCTRTIRRGELVDMSSEFISDIERHIAGFQENACRILAFAHREFAAPLDFECGKAVVESGMVFDGFVAITDPLREDVLRAVEHCKNAGIDLKILTGDNIITARAIAGRLGVLNDGVRVVEAQEIEPLSDEELRKALPGIKVIARSTPVLKMRVVKALKENGNVVAVTGDGINDAPAIKYADVGIAMGITGTEVSKEASDIVLLDDSFSTIVKAVQWGRGIYENFQRFIQFQLAVNLSSVVVILISLLAGYQAPFSALQLLWINIIMDGPPALTLGLEPIRSDLLSRKPISRYASVVTKGMLLRIVFSGLFISLMFQLQTMLNVLGATPEQQPAVLFSLFVIFQLLNAFNARELSDTSIFVSLVKNKLMLLVFGLVFVLQVVITQFGGAIYDTVPLPATMWIKIVCYSMTVIVASELFRLAKRIFGKAHRAAKK